MNKILSSYGKRLLAYVLAFSVIVVSMLSMFIGQQLFSAAAGNDNSDITIWGGADSLNASTVSFAGGTGKSTDPYLISNGDQLYKMIYDAGQNANGAAFYKLTDDIYLNDVSEVKWYEKSNLNNWYAKLSDLVFLNSSDTAATKIFKGNFDGDNHTIYGIYIDSAISTIGSGIYAGLIPVSGADASITSLNLSHIYITSATNRHSGAMIGQAQGILDISKSSISNYILKGGRGIDGGFVGQAQKTAVFTDCIISDSTTKCGFVGGKFAGNVITLNNCISVGIMPVGYKYFEESQVSQWKSYVFNNVVTTEKDSNFEKTITYNNVTSKPASTGSIYQEIKATKLTGTDAETLLKGYGFNFSKIWIATESYPKFRSSTAWDGYSANVTYDKTIFTDGDGSKEKPFIISNGDQLYAMILMSGKVDGKSAYFKLGNDIYLNNVNSASEMTSGTWNNWIHPDWKAPGDIPVFAGHFDGDYHTIYGLYAKHHTRFGNNNSGLIPNIADGSSVKNLNVTDAYIWAGVGFMGGIVGSTYPTNSAIYITLDSCSVTNSIISGTENNKIYGAGGLVGGGVVVPTITDCYTHSLAIEGNSAQGCVGGLIGFSNVASTCVMSNCYSAGYYPIGSGSRNFDKIDTNVSNVYTDQDKDAIGGSVTAFKVLEKEKMQGSTALENMVFDDASKWKVTTDYPIVCASSSSLPPEEPPAKEPNENVWSGYSESVTYDKSIFTEGDGSESNPFIITNGDQLYAMILMSGKSDGKSAYFKLANDIYLNDVESADELKNGNWNNWIHANWKSATDIPVFAGHLDGDYHTVYGLYAVWSARVGDGNAGLIPNIADGASIKNINVKNAYMYSKIGFMGGIVGSSYPTNEGARYFTLDNSSVTDSIICGTENNKKFGAGGLVGGGVAVPTINDCYTYGLTIEGNSAQGCVGGLIGFSNVASTCVMNNCYSAGYYPIGSGSRNFDKIDTNVFNVYTDQAKDAMGGSVTAFKVLETEKMQGSTALENIVFDDISKWQTTEKFPIVVKPIEDESGTGSVPNPDSKFWAGYSSNITYDKSIFTEGDGSSSKPYIITNGDQLYAMILMSGKSDGKDAYFKLANDIYLNDVQSEEDMKKGKWNNWIHADWKTANDVPIFAGHLNGSGYTVYGLYAVWTRRVGDGNAGLIPNVADGASIKNINVKNAYISTPIGFMGGIVGSARTKSFVEIECCSVTNSIICGTENGKNYGAGGIIGGGLALPIMNNCYTYAITLEGNSENGCVGGLLGFSNAFGNIKIQNCYSAGYYPAGSFNDSYSKVTDSNIINYSNTYTNCSKDEAGNSTKAFITLTAAQMKGATALNNMIFDDPILWQTTDNFPILRPLEGSGDEEESDSKVWTGSVASEFASGSGSEQDPFIIRTAGQLYKMVKESGKDPKGNPAYYKVADDVDNIYLNDVAGKNAEEAKAYLEKYGLQWFNGGEFFGIFDGNGVNVHGLYSKSKNDVGLIPCLGNGATVININIYNSVTESNASRAGVLTSRARNGASVVIKNISVVDSFATGASDTAAIIGSTGNGNVHIENILVKNVKTSVTDAEKQGRTAAIVSDGWGKITVKNSLVLGSYPVAVVNANTRRTNFTYKNVYTNVSPESNASDYASKITIIKYEDIIGEKAKNILKFDWNYGWKTVSGSNPVPLNEPIYNGKPGEVWSGKVATTYLGGSGTYNDPYLIDTPERLYKMITETAEGAYYQITEDIYLNNVNSSEWYKGSGLNEWVKDADAFTAHLDGSSGGVIYTIYGLYYGNVENGKYAGLIPILGSKGTVMNIKLASSYISSSATENSAAGSIVGTVLNDALAVMIEGCIAEESVILNGGYRTGGILGTVQKSATVGMNNCGFKGSIVGNPAIKGGLVAEAVGSINICESYSIDTYAVGKGGNVRNVYSNISQSKSPEAQTLGVGTLTKEQMTGENAVSNMKGFDFEKIWKTTSKYPEIKTPITTTDGVVGEVWTGKMAVNYAGGTGSQEDPYLIGTGEQLFKMVNELPSSNGKHYKLIADIKLNDVYGRNWQEKKGLNSWVAMSGVAFWGHLDGDGYVVYGMYYADENVTGKYVSLIPVVGSGSIVENVGISEAYIDIPTTNEETYAAGIAAAVHGFLKNVDDRSVANVAKLEKEFPMPIIRNCFADHTVKIAARNTGGLVGGLSSYVHVENSFFTGSVTASSKIVQGAIIGDAWKGGSRVINCFGLTQEMGPFCGGTVWRDWASNDDIYLEGSYYFGGQSNSGMSSVDYEGFQGHDAKEHMPELFKSGKWETVSNGTPVLSVFNKPTHKASEFSFTGSFETTISFRTNADEIILEPITAPIRSKVTLPTPTREGYIFEGWYVYPEFQCEYDYGYMPFRDLVLYGKWVQTAIIQDFEDYPNTYYDVANDYQYYRPGVKGYKIPFTHGGIKSMHRVGEYDEQQDFLINYEDMLTVGDKYKMTFWMCTDSDGTNAEISIVHNTWPDIAEPDLGVEKVISETGLVSGEWKQYTTEFTAKTKWISIRTNGGASLYFDDFMLFTTGSGGAVDIENVDSNNEGKTNSLKGILLIGGITIASVVAVAGVVISVVIIKKRKKTA